MQRGEHGLDTAGEAFVPIAQHVADDLAFDSEKMPERFSDGSEEDESEIKIEPQKAERKVINILANKPKTCGL